LRAFLASWNKIAVFVSSLLPIIFLTLCGSESGRQKFQKQAFGVGVVAQINISKKWKFS